MVSLQWKTTTIGKKSKVRFERKTNFGDLICTFNHTIRPTGFIFNISESARMFGKEALYSLEFVTDDYLYPGHVPSVHFSVLNTTGEFHETQFFTLLKPYIDELTGEITLTRYYRDEYTEKADCGCHPHQDCNCDGMQ